MNSWASAIAAVAACGDTFELQRLRFKPVTGRPLVCRYPRVSTLRFDELGAGGSQLDLT